jgi:mannose-6-phosphate isomerase
VKRLTGPIRPYAWGSDRVLAEIQGRPAPSPGPEAELWFGAHPADPSYVSTVDGEVALPEYLAADPEATLGALAATGTRLPYLLKVLAAARPLSLQAHPDGEQARAGYAAESAMGLADDKRSYVDPYHKPELLVALSRFRALCGFRDPDVSAADLARLATPDLDPVIASLHSGPVAGRLRRAVELIMALPGEAVRRAVASARDGLAAELGARYPDDAGVLVALLLNNVRLDPDDAVFMPAGNLHAYLDGAGIEVMAASDNVLRGGLTGKHVDVSELQRVLRYEVVAAPVLRPVALAPGVVTWPVPVPDFTLLRATVSGVVGLAGSGPRIVFCLRGPVDVRAGTQRVSLRGGEAVFVGAVEPAVECAGTSAVVFQAGTALGSF